jgi:hypothetical protein
MKEWKEGTRGKEWEEGMGGWNGRMEWEDRNGRKGMGRKEIVTLCANLGSTTCSGSCESFEVIGVYLLFSKRKGQIVILN